MTLIGLTGGMPRYNPYEALAAKLVLAVDWRRDDLVTVSGSPALASSILDVIAAADFAQASGSLQPGYEPPGGFTFDGLDDQATLAAMPLPSGASPWYYIGLFDQAAVASNTTARCLAAWGGTTTNTSVSIYRTVSGGVNRATVEIPRGGSRVALTYTTVDLSGVHFIETWYDGTNGYLSVDGGAPTSAAVAQSLSATRVRLGLNTAGAQPWLGDEFLNFWLDALPTTDERAELVSYFNDIKGTL